MVLSSGVGTDAPPPVPPPSLSGHAGRGPPRPPWLLQQREGADQVWGAVQVLVDMTGEWAIKPRGRRFMGHLLLPGGQRSGIGDFVHLNIIRRLEVSLDPPPPPPAEHSASNYRAVQF